MDGAKLRELRKKLHLSQTAFGKRIFASQSQMRDWEQGLYKIPLWAVKNIEREFFTPSGEVKPAPEEHIEKLTSRIIFLLRDPGMFEYMKIHTGICEDALRERQRNDALEKTLTPSYVRHVKRRIDAPLRETEVPGMVDGVSEDPGPGTPDETGQGVPGDTKKDKLRVRKGR